jgi:hypothetical protein
MNNQDRKIIEGLENQFYQIASQAIAQENIEREDIENMKDLQKICYYMEVRCAMKEGDGYDDGEYMNDMEYQNRSYGNRYYNGNGNMNMSNRGNSYARGGMRNYSRRNVPYMNGNSGRRYYDGNEKDNSMNDLMQMIQMEQDPEKRAMLEGIKHVLENDK